MNLGHEVRQLDLIRVIWLINRVFGHGHEKHMRLYQSIWVLVTESLRRRIELAGYCQHSGLLYVYCKLAIGLKGVTVLEL